MKKTTLALFAFIALALLAAISFSTWLAIKAVPFKYSITIPETDRSLSTRQLSAFSHISVANKDKHVSCTGSDLNILFCEDATVLSPKIIFPSALNNLLQTSVVDQTLTLTFNYDSVIDTAADNVSNWLIEVNVPLPVTVVMPKGSIEALKIGEVSDIMKFELKDLNLKYFHYDGFRDLTFTGCRLDTFTTSSQGEQYRKEPLCNLSFKNSTVGRMEVVNCVSDLVLATDSVSIINNLIRRPSGNEYSHLDIAAARVRHFSWQPDSAADQLRLTVSTPFNVEFNND